MRERHGDLLVKGPIRYFGGKGCMFQSIIDQFPDGFNNDEERNKSSSNNLDADTYIEAFGGGASVLFQKSPSPVEIYNDLNKNVYSLFYVLQNKKLFKVFKEKCDLSYFSKDVFVEFSESLKTDNISVLERAFRFFYINKVSYNGSGSFSYITNFIRRGMSKSVSDMLSSINRLEEIHCRLKSVVIENQDAVDLIRKFDRKNVLFYLDPPYHHDTRSGSRYETDMTNEQHENLLRVLLDIKKANILISGYNVGLYDKLVDKGWKRIDFDVTTQGGNRATRTKTESLWRNYKLKDDDIERE